MTGAGLQLSGDAKARADFRTDIQFLRGVAVLLVVFFHAFESALPKGFLGVDIFFVISGFLVTTIIVRDLEAGRFSLKHFYFRRVRRIVPALLSTLLLTTLAAHWILVSFEWDEYLRQLVASLLFGANLLLSRRDGYFGPLPEQEPLRHLWSLAVEEQFYIVIPLFLMLLPGRWRLRGLAIVGAITLLLSVVGASVAPILTFYNLPTRTWQFIAGALCGFAVVRDRFAPRPVLCWLALGVLAGVAFVGIDDHHPRGDAVLAVAAVCLILLSRDQWLPRNWLTLPIVKAGDCSYSLYLIHWPLISFTHLAAGRPPTPAMLAGALLLSFLLAALQYRWIELPFWRGWKAEDRRPWWLLAAMFASLLAVAAPSLAWVLSGEGRRQAAILELRMGLPGCAHQAGTGILLERCRTGPDPKLAIYGDSFAMHLVDGILADKILRKDFVQISSLGCAPVLGYSPMWPGNNSQDPAACIRYNDLAVRDLERSSVRVVVISSPFDGVLANDDRPIWNGSGAVSWSPGLSKGFIGVVERLRRVGKSVIIVAPPPHTAFDIARCNLQVQQGLFRLSDGDCRLRRDQLEPGYDEVLAKLRGIAAATGSHLLVPEDVLCRGKVCATHLGGRLLYRDGGHFTELGSMYVVRRLGLNELVRDILAGRDRPARSRARP